jgi:glycosyltransferase involved in cell wall biosynthesis
LRKILQIASIFPVQDAPEENPYVRKFVLKYSKKHDHKFAVLKPESSLPWLLIPVSDKPGFFWLKKRKICRKGYYNENQLSIFVLPYFSVGSINWLHSLFASVIWNLNKKRLLELAAENVGLIHAHYLFPDGMLAYQLHKRLGIPYMLTLQQELRFLKDRISLKRVKKIIENASIVTTLSPQMKLGLEAKGIGNVQLLPLGIENYFLEQVKKPVFPVEKNRKLKMLSVCNLLPIKNLASVILAIDKLSAQDKEEIDYTIYGVGSEEQALRKMVSNLKLDHLVHFKGTVENKELPDVMSKYDIYIQPSFKETFGLSYFEAMACGLPVILTKNTGAYEIIKDRDVYYVVDPYQPDSVQACIHGILKDRDSLSKKATHCPETARIASWDNFIDFFHNKYEEVVRGV